MKLALEIEFLTGVYRGSTGPAATVTDWPPQPDRAFSALVAAWAARGQRPDETAALEWLERQSAPTVHASGSEPRTAPEVYVPPNDPTVDRAKLAGHVLPATRARQPRRFPATRPKVAVMHMVWDQPADPHLPALNALARDVTYLGHSSSLVRCLFRVGGGEHAHAGVPARTRLYAGRLRELTDAHADNPVRPVIPAAAANPVRESAEPPARPAAPLVLEAIGQTPDILASAVVCRQLRRTLMGGYRRAFGADRIPEEISGHAPDGSPTKAPHLAIQPMAFVGHRHADGRVFGYALIPPRGSGLLTGPEFRSAFAAVADFDEGHERRVLTLRGDPLPAHVELAPAGHSPVRSLRFDPYVDPARVWASVTPVVLDRHLKREPDREARDLVVLACERAGLPRPDPGQVLVGRQTTFIGVPSASASKTPAWSRWRVPSGMSSRPLRHVVVDFGVPVHGPVLLGAGRFNGLGLCRGVGTDGHRQDRG